MSSDPKYDELHKQLFEEGLKMRRSVVGDEYVNRALENGSTEFSRAGQELVTEFCWDKARPYKATEEPDQYRNADGS
jgi:4-carboxymuconolactone decarboxylase